VFKKISCFATLVLAFSFSTSLSYGQLLGLYEFDGGGDGTSWDDATNWEQKLDPNGLPLAGDPATPPGPVTSADIPLAGVVVDIAGQTALDVNVGTAAGVGSVTLSAGGALDIGRDLFVGRDGGGANGGSFNMTGGSLPVGDDITIGAGSAGSMTMSGGTASAGDDVFVNAGSSLSVTGGTLTVGDRLISDDDGVVSVDGGDVVANDDFFFYGSSQITVDSGSMIVKDKLRFDNVLTTGLLTINDGLVRSQEFGFHDGVSYVMNGTLEVNGGGIYQSEAPGPTSPVSQLSVAHAKHLINIGTITTSEVFPLGLIVSSVIVPDFFGSPNLEFTQISIGIVPEPTSLALLSIGAMGLVMRRRRSR